jgi:hypothetical protein
MTATTSETFMPAIAEAPSGNQRMFVRYFTGTLIDLVVLNLFAEYWSEKVIVASFTISLLAAILLQVLIKATIAVEHWVAGFFKGKTGGMWVFLRFFSAWLVLFGSKFVILEALSTAFSGEVAFKGILHGIIPLVIVVVVMLLAEELIVRLYRRLN